MNRAVAVGLADGPLAGLAVLDPVLRSGQLDGYGPLHAAHADLLDRAGRLSAAAAWARAIETTENGPLRDELIRWAADRANAWMKARPACSDEPGTCSPVAVSPACWKKILYQCKPPPIGDHLHLVYVVIAEAATLSGRHFQT